MDGVRDAFHKVKEDFSFLKSDVDSLKSELDEVKQGLIDACEAIYSLNDKISSFLDKKEEPSKDSPVIQTDSNLFPSDNVNRQTNRQTLRLGNDQILGISTGNEGVQTNRQTDKQTNRQTEKAPFKAEDAPLYGIENASELIGSLDKLKKEVRLKFKRLTDQEVLVFSTIYLLEEEVGFSNYKSISNKLKLSESSIRDYVRRLIMKGIPLEKSKVNNKEVQIFISPNLKKIASLNTILQLRDL